MNKDGVLLVFLTVFVVFTMHFAGYMRGIERGREEMEREIVKRGYGEYKVIEDRVQFQWNKK